jgi:hypothetical protein
VCATDLRRQSDRANWAAFAPTTDKDLDAVMVEAYGKERGASILFKKWEEEIENGRFANGALIGYHPCKSERRIPTNFYGIERDIHAPSIALSSSSCFPARSDLFAEWQ